MGIKEAINKKKEELKQKRLGKVMAKVGKEQEKKETEFKNIVSKLDEQMIEFGKYANGLNQEVIALTKRVEEIEKWKNKQSQKDF